MYCTNCGAESSKKVCSTCGEKQDKTHKYCKWCGSEITENASVCVQCNKKVKENKFFKFVGILFEIILSVAFVVILFFSFAHFSNGAIIGGILVLLVSALGIFVSNPFIRKIISKKENSKKLKSLRTTAIAVAIIGTLIAIPFANNQEFKMEQKAKYDAAIAIMESDPIASKESLLSLGGFEDSSEKAEEADQYIYNKLEEELKSDFSTQEELSEVREYVDALPEDFNDERDLLTEFRYKEGVWAMNNNFFARARYLFKEIPDYKDVAKYMDHWSFKFMGNTYICSSSFSYGFETYINTYMLSFSDSVNHSFFATYRSANSKLSDTLSGDFGGKENLNIDYNCYDKDGKLYVGTDEITAVKIEKDKVVAFVYNDLFFEISE